MNTRSINDSDLLKQIKIYAQNERDAVVKILHHLREIERRRLYADLGYKSLFDYAVRELKYSEGQASRRVQAMRLVKEIPEIEEKIATGELSLSNAHQAQTFFRELQNADPQRIVTKAEKGEILDKLANKSVREGQKELLKLQPSAALPKERERPIKEDTSEVRFLMSDALKDKLEQVRSLLGTKGAAMSYAELFAEMSELAIASLEAKRFGKRRTAGEVEKKAAVLASTRVASTKNPRYIPQATKHIVWQRDRGCCVNCGSRRNLNYDHVKPVALGGESLPENLRLLCFGCNQRASTKVFGRVFEKGKSGER